MEKWKFGNNNFYVSALGYGAGHIGGDSLSEAEAINILNLAYDNGITLFDTARGYGLSEERVGKFLKDKRNSVVLSSKVGYGIQGYEDWTYDIIIKGVDEALRIMGTDYIDIVHLHSCPIYILEKGDVIKALLKTKEAGKILCAAYSGENEELDYAVKSNCFDSIQTSINITDQYSLKNIIPEAVKNGLGVIAKRPIANAFWIYNEQPYGNYAEEYWKRWKSLELNTSIETEELFIRFSGYANGVCSSIIGSANKKHIQKNIEIFNKGRLTKDILNEIDSIYAQKGSNWRGEI